MWTVVLRDLEGNYQIIRRVEDQRPFFLIAEVPILVQTLEDAIEQVREYGGHLFMLKGERGKKKAYLLYEEMNVEDISEDGDTVPEGQGEREQGDGDDETS